jgi:hypothetical protein
MNYVRTNLTESSPQKSYAVESLTGIYIGCVLLLFLLTLVIYFLYLYYKRENLRKHESNDPNNGQDMNEQMPFLNSIKALGLTDNKSSNSMLLDTDIFQIDQYSDRSKGSQYTLEKCSISNNSQQVLFKQNSSQFVQSRVSLLLLSSLLSNNSNSNISANNNHLSTSINDNGKILVRKLSSKNRLDKEMANEISNQISKYCEEQRKLVRVSSLKSYKCKRSRSLNDVQLENLKRNTPKKKKLNAIHNYNNEHKPKGCRRYYSERLVKRRNSNIQRKKSEFRALLTTPSQSIKRVHSNGSNVSNQKFSPNQRSSVSISSEKPKKPTTIYELYKLNKLQISSLFDPLDTNN